MSGRYAMGDLRHAPLPVCPPLLEGEAFTSWMNRIAARNHLPLALVLARLDVAAGDRHGDMPTDYGLSLRPAQVAAVAKMTGTEPDAISGSLLERFHGGAVDLTAYHDDPRLGLAAAARSEWFHLSRSPFCPDCLRDTDGAWQLRWRLPWAYVCPTHGTLLVPVCPGCDQPAGRGRGDRTLRPGFIADVPDPVRCRNSVVTADPRYPTRPGRAAKPCGYDLTAAPTSQVGGIEPVMTAQATLDGLIATGGHRETWQDVRAVTATLMYFADTVTLDTLAPDLAQRLFTSPTLVEAVTAVERDRAARGAVQEHVRAVGRDHRTGARQRYGTTTPTDPALMAVLAPLALALNGGPEQTSGAALASRAGRLTVLASLARSQHRKLPQMFEATGATPALVADADAASRATGRFHYAIAGQAPDDEVSPHLVPAFLWADQAAPFVDALPNTREDTIRMFASMTIVKRLTGDSWADVTARLGLPATKARLTSSLVNRLTQAGTQTNFLKAADAVIGRLASGDIPPVDYGDRRRLLRRLTTVPAAVLHAADPTLVATAARRHNSAVWLWAELTGGHPWEAPAWGTGRPTRSDKDVYRRFTQRDLAGVRTALSAHGRTLLEGG